MNLWVVETHKVRRYAASEAEARKLRNAIVVKSGAKKSEVEIAPLEYSTKKPELLAFLNKRERHHDLMEV